MRRVHIDKDKLYHDYITLNKSVREICIEPPCLYGYARCVIGKDDEGNLIYDNPWVKEDVEAFKTPKESFCLDRKKERFNQIL